jgi:hypothetical protein
MRKKIRTKWKAERKIQIKKVSLNRLKKAKKVALKATKQVA